MRSMIAALALIAAAWWAQAAGAANPADGLVLAAGSGGKTGVVCVAPGETPTASREKPASSSGVELAQDRGAACVSRCRDSLSSCESGCRDYQCRSSCSSRYSSCLSRCPP